MLGEGLVQRARESRHLLVGGKDYLFKGVKPSGFGKYFANGGITPHPQQTVGRAETWVTNDLRRALFFSGYPTEQLCLAVARREPVLKSSNLQPHFSPDRTITGLRLRDYSGSGIIEWDNVVGLVTTAQSLERIQEDYDRVAPRDVNWQEIEAKAVFVAPGNKADIKNKALELISR